MKTMTGKYLPIFFLLIASVSISSFAFAQNERNNHDHLALAAQYENVAKEMQAKVEQQKEIFNNKPRSSYLGRNGQRIVKRVTSRIRKYEEAAKENYAKAEYHIQIAAQQSGAESVAKPGQANEQINKAKKRLNTESSL
jgi:hypothetical protein